MLVFTPRYKAWLAKHILCSKPVVSAQSDLMERLSHEFRTSLTGIVGYSEFVEANSNEPMVNFTAKIIRESSQTLARTSNAYIDLCRLNEGQIRLTSSEFSFNDKVRDIVRGYQRQAFENGANLNIYCLADENLLTMYADAAKVTQIVDGLVYWAVHMSDKEQTILINVLPADGTDFFTLEVLFQDGSASEAKFELIRQFWSEEEYKFRLQEGPGVELALIKALICFLNGTVEFRLFEAVSPKLIVKLPRRYR